MYDKNEPSGLHEKGKIPESEVIHLGSHEFGGDSAQSTYNKKKSGCFIPFLLIIIVFACIAGAFIAGLMLDENSVRSSQLYSRITEKLSFFDPDEPEEEEESDFDLFAAPSESEAPQPEKDSFYEMISKGDSAALFGSDLSSGWAYDSNVGILNTSVKEGSREKFTQLVGDGSDKVTVMIYVCGGDLEAVNGMATADIREMLSARTGKNVNVLLCTGGSTKWRTKGISTEKNQLFKIENGELVHIDVDMGNGSMTDAATLYNFLRYCGWQYPANRNILILRDHGGNALTGFGYDKNHPDSAALSLSELDHALSDTKMKFDIIGFDASLMASFETAAAFSKHADYMIASEELMPDSGWYYTNWITRLNNYPSVSSTNLAKQIIDDCVDHSSSDVTLSLVDLAEFSSFIPDKMTDFASAVLRECNAGAYDRILSARNNAREFASFRCTDQIDLVQFAKSTDTVAGKNLARGILSAVKYNRTSANSVNSYGLSVYSPFHSPEKASSAVELYNMLGVDPVCSRCLNALAAIESAARSIAAGESYSAYSSMLGELSGSTVYGSGAFGGYSSALDVLNELIPDEQLESDTVLDKEKAAAYLNKNRFFPTQMVWSDNADTYEMHLTEDNRRMVSSLSRNLFYNNGKGFVDLGEDTAYQVSDSGALQAGFDGKWLAVNGQPVPFYRIDTVVQDGEYRVTGRIPILYNAMRADLIVVFDKEHPDGHITGVCYDYANGQTDTLPKVLSAVRKGVRIDFLCGFYDYGGNYVDDYKFGERIIPESELILSRVSFPDAASLILMFKFTDIYGQSYWSPVAP